jgi:hypothetical protein
LLVVEEVVVVEELSLMVVVELGLEQEGGTLEAVAVASAVEGRGDKVAVPV